MQHVEVRPVQNNGSTCATCKHMHREHLDPQNVTAVVNQCRRFPPQLVVHVGMNGQGVASQLGTHFAQVPDVDQAWCGEFAPKLDG